MTRISNINKGVPFDESGRDTKSDLPKTKGHLGHTSYHDSLAGLGAAPDRFAALLEHDFDGYEIRATTRFDPEVLVKIHIPDLPNPLALSRRDCGKCPDVEVTHIYGGRLPPGSGHKLIISVLEEYGIVPTGTLVFRAIQHEATLHAYANGSDPARTVLGRIGASVIRSIGSEPVRFRFVPNEDDEIDLLIDIDAG